MQKNAHDYIIIGAGSSGCVLANRLSADVNNKVLLLEAGNKDINPWLHIPVGYFKTMHNPKTDWCYITEPDKGINKRKLQWPRGKVLGGSSSLNGLLYVRGQAQDYDDWSELGNKGWSFKEVLPYFKKSENQERGSDKYHEIDGPLRVSDLRSKRKIAAKFIQSCVNIGIPLNEDSNGKTQEGVGYFQQTAYNGRRCSTSQGFLKPIKNRHNLTIITLAQVTKIIFDGKKASAVEYKLKSKIYTVNANKEILLSAGTINSPQLLQCSGIGDKKLLDKLNITIINNLKGVGQNLQDHLQVRLIYKTKDKTFNDEVNSQFKKLLAGLQYIFKRTGPLTLAASQVCVFTKSNKNIDRVDIQFHMQPLSADKPGKSTHQFSAFTSSVCQLRPYSKGYVEITSKNSLIYPKIYPNYLSDKRDCKVVIDAIKVARKIANQSPLKDTIIEEFVPGDKYQTDEELLQTARKHSQTIYHPVGTCKMGNDDMSVVDSRLKVYGVEGLRVIDASIMPKIISGNTNAPTIMIAEKASDMILADNK